MDDWARSQSADEHGGCRVCGRTDVTLKADGTLRVHVHSKGSSFLQPKSARCPGAGYTPKGVIDGYARAVIRALAEDFPDLQEALTAEVIGEAITAYRVTPNDMFECLLTPSGTWRLRGHRDIPGRVRVACWKPADRTSDADRYRERAANARLDVLR